MSDVIHYHAIATLCFQYWGLISFLLPCLPRKLLTITHKTLTILGDGINTIYGPGRLFVLIWGMLTARLRSRVVRLTQFFFSKTWGESCIKSTSSSSSTIRLRPLGMFLPPGNQLPISFVIFLYFFSLQVCNLKVFWVVCCHPFFVYIPSNLFYIALICR